MKQFLLTLGMVALLAGCGSAVKLNDVPVEDKSGTVISQTGTEFFGTAVDQGGITSQESRNAAQYAAIVASPRTVYFDYDSFLIKPEFQSVVATHARYIMANKSVKVAIEGHTDERGGREYNLALGQKRAEAVRSAMGLLGVSDNQVEAVSFGKEKLAAQGFDEEAMAKNRRAEISYR